MAYGQQSFQTGQVLTAQQMNQVEFNIRDHRHARGDVASIFEAIASNSGGLLQFSDGGKALFVNATKTVTIAPASVASGWYVAIFNTSSLASDIVTINPGGSLIDCMSYVDLGPQQGCMVVAYGNGATVDFSTIGRPATSIPQNLQNSSYVLARTDAGKHIYHNIGSNHLYTIPANSGMGSVSFPIGTAISFVNANSAGNMYIICSDTLRKVTSGATDTGTRTVAMNGMASALKVSSNAWVINGTGLA